MEIACYWCHRPRIRVTEPFTRRPQTNGKAERFIGTIQREWAYARLFRSNQERLATLPGWVDAYNRRRPHAGLDGQTPLSVLVNKVEENDN